MAAYDKVGFRGNEAVNFKAFRILTLVAKNKAGTYSSLRFPARKGMTIILNQTRLWEPYSYTGGMMLVRITVPTKSLSRSGGKHSPFDLRIWEIILR